MTPAAPPKEPKPARRDHSEGFVYFVSDGESIKIGKANNVKSRLSGLQTGHAKKHPKFIPIEFSICSIDVPHIDRNPLLVKYSYMRRTIHDYNYQIHCVDKAGDVIETIGEMNIWTVAFAAFNAAARSI